MLEDHVADTELIARALKNNQITFTLRLYIVKEMVEKSMEIYNYLLRMERAPHS